MSLMGNMMQRAGLFAAIFVVGLALTGCGSDDSGAGPDSDAPEITEGPTVTSLTETSARITWTTSEVATSAVDFGLSSSYGATEETTALTTEHSVLVTDLTPYTTYHCRAVSADVTGNAVTSDDVAFLTDKDLTLFMSDGWLSLSGGDIDGARESFVSAMAKDATSGDPHIGLGWCEWMEGDLSGAYTEFYGAVALDSDHLDAIAARACVGVDRGEFAQSIADAQQVLDADPTYTFSGVEGFNYYDLQVTLARCFYAEGEYESAQEVVDTINPHNPLDPGSSSYTTSLLAAINSLHAEFVEDDQGGGSRPPTLPSGDGF